MSEEKIQARIDKEVAKAVKAERARALEAVKAALATVKSGE